MSVMNVVFLSSIYFSPLYLHCCSSLMWDWGRAKTFDVGTTHTQNMSCLDTLVWENAEMSVPSYCLVVDCLLQSQEAAAEGLGQREESRKGKKDEFV